MKQTVTSKYEPKSKNVTWIDMSTGSPVQKNFINGMWRSTGGSGGGAGLSNPTEADATKVWQVTPVQKGTKTEEIVIVPQQTLEEGQELEYNDKFVPGAQCVAVINGVEYSGEVIKDGNTYEFNAEFGGFEYHREQEEFVFFNDTDYPEVTAKLSIIEETTTYDYNWVPGVKIPVPTAEDEGKILVVTKVEGDNTSTIVPEQEVPADDSTPLTDVDLKYFVPGNTVTVTVTVTKPDEPDEEERGGDVALKGPKSANSKTLVASGTIEQVLNGAGVIFNEGQENEFSVNKVPYGEPTTPPIVGPKSINTKSSTDTEYILVTNLCDLFGGDIHDAGGVKGNSGLRGNTLPYVTIKLEYSESNYEYQLQENSGGGSSNILYCEGSIDLGTVTAYIDSSELENPQITTIAVNTGETTEYFYRMGSNGWLVSRFNTFSDSDDWIKGWNTEGQYPTILAFFSQK